MFDFKKYLFTTINSNLLKIMFDIIIILKDNEIFIKDKLN